MTNAINRQLPTIMSHDFSKIPGMQIPRSSFRRPSGWKGTINVGDLIPVYLDEVLPGDVHKIRAHMFGRLATSLYPIMDNIYIDTMVFFAANRYLWKNWEKFQGAQDNPGDSTDFLIPHVESGGYANFPALSLGDMFGLPTEVNIPPAKFPISAIPFRMYNKIFNTWIRDQNLQDSVYCPDDDGPDDLAQYVILKRGKRHDYITSSAPEPQKGPGVQLPLGGLAPVIPDVSGANTNVPTMYWQTSPSDSALFVTGTTGGTVAGTAGTYNLPVYPADGDQEVLRWAQTGMVANLANSAAATINDLREAIVMQQMQELDMRGGTRYVEAIKARFGVISPDFRLQRPEYIGGSSQRINISAIAQTSRSEGLDTEAPHPQANLAAYGTMGVDDTYTYSAVEHGYIMVLVNVRADLTYQQYINRMWLRQTRSEFYEPLMAHLGEQAVSRVEVKFEGDSSDDLVWGYQERWAEYRYKQSLITGLFRSNHPQSLDAWHLALDLTNPQLNAAFIEDAPPIARTQAVQDEPPVLLDCYFETVSHRPIPIYSTPGVPRI